MRGDSFLLTAGQHVACWPTALEVPLHISSDPVSGRVSTGEDASGTSRFPALLGNTALHLCETDTQANFLYWAIAFMFLLPVLVV